MVGAKYSLLEALDSQGLASIVNTPTGPSPLRWVRQLTDFQATCGLTCSLCLRFRPSDPTLTIASGYDHPKAPEENRI